jgi:AsmA protein
MKRVLKIGAIAGTVAVVLIAALMVAAKILITPERVRGTVLPMAEKALHRPVELGDIQVGLFSGISLKDLVVREKEGNEVFVAAKKAVLRYQFWPLLRLKVVVDEVSLQEPSIRVVRLADGSFNFSDLAGSRDDAAEPVEKAPAKVPPLDMLISEVGIRGGKLLFVDHAAGGPPPVQYELGQLEATATDISLNRSFPFEVSGLLNQAPLKIKGRIDPAAGSGSAAVSLANLDVTAFAPYFKKAIPGRLQSLILGLDLQVEGGSKELATSGKVSLTNLGLVLDAQKEAPIQKGRLTIEHDLKFSKEADRLAVKAFKADYNGIVVEASGNLEKLTTGPTADLTVRLPALALKQAIAAAPAGLVRGLAALDPAGKIAAEARITGPLAKTDTLLAGAWLKLENVQITAGGLRPSLMGRLELTGNRLLAHDLMLGDGTNQAQLELRADNLFGKPIVVRHTLTAKRFLLDPLLAAGTTAKPAAPRQAAEPAKEPGPFDLPVTAEGQVHIGETLYKGLAVRNFNMAYRLEKNVLTVTRLDGDLAEGHFADTARLDLGKTPLTYQGRLNLKGIQAQPFLHAFLPKFDGMVTGAVDLDLEASGRGTLPDAAKRNLQGKGTVSIANGHLANTPVVQKFATFVGLEELKEVDFDRVDGRFTITDGRVALNSEIKGGDVRMEPQGTVGLDGTLALRLSPKFSPYLTKKLDSRGRFTSFLTDAEGWSELPLMVGGTVTAPRFALDTTGVRQQVKQKVQEKVKETIQRKLLDRVAPPAQPAEQGTAPAPAPDVKQQLLDKAVRGLFGK